MWELKTLIEVIKSIPAIKQVWNSLSYKPIKIEVFPKQSFEQPSGTYEYAGGKWYPKRPIELFDNNKCTAVSIINNGNETIRLDQITLDVYVKKGCLRKTKVDEFKSDKFIGGFPSTIPPRDDERLSFSQSLDEVEKDTLVYEVIAEMNNRKIKHVHKVKAS